jgi:hypothetical protein
MKKLLVALFTLVALSFGAQSFAACPCQTDPGPCAKSSTTCDDILSCTNVEDYFCKIGLNECQKDQARIAVNKFKCDTQCLTSNACNCENKCECRAYRKALRNLDCAMKNIITKCQKADYKCVKHEIKDQVKCCHKCLINPFSRCKCACSCK